MRRSHQNDGSPEGLSEAYGASLISWVCTHAEALSEPSEVATAIDYAIEMRKNQDPSYTLTADAKDGRRGRR